MCARRRTIGRPREIDEPLPRFIAATGGVCRGGRVRGHHHSQACELTSSPLCGRRTECHYAATRPLRTPSGQLHQACCRLKSHRALPRLPQTRAASFKWLYRKRPGPETLVLVKLYLPGRFRYSSNTSRPLTVVAHPNRFLRFARNPRATWAEPARRLGKGSDVSDELFSRICVSDFRKAETSSVRPEPQSPRLVGCH